MKPSLGVRLDALARRLTPFGLTLLLVVFNLVPLHIPGYDQIVPLLPLIAVYHWTFHRSELMPAYAVFVIGLLQDSLTGAPIGINAVVFLIVHGATLSQRRFLAGKSFAMFWLVFALVAAGAMATSWILVCAYNLALVEPRALLFQYLLTTGIFPILAWFFLRWQRAILRPE
ncbi:MAG: rod shape-determining protein MreD [Rhodospirillales bacterium]|jgi:rod shape-determining protein MreD|nr:rod shape-determining protein MreD [Rhodospirillales bacterium]